MHMLSYPVLPVEYIAGRKILINPHFILYILIGGLAVETNAGTIVAYINPGSQQISSIQSFIIVVYGFCCSVIGIVQSVWISSLIRILVGSYETGGPMGCRFPYQSDSSCSIIKLVRFLMGIQVCKKAIIVVVIAANG